MSHPTVPNAVTSGGTVSTHHRSNSERSRTRADADGRWVAGASRTFWAGGSSLLLALALYTVHAAASGTPLTGVVVVLLCAKWLALGAFVGARQALRAARMSDSTGWGFCRYRLERVIGHGGTSEIWLAWDKRLRREVALKVARRSTSVAGYELASFEREARACGTLSSPHTIRVFDVGAREDGAAYMAMEHLVGEDLATLVRSRGPLVPARAVYFARQACRALVEAHDAGVIHRDVKPDNLFVTCVGETYDFLKLVDFGIARVPGPACVESHAVSGTPAYMAPEVWASRGSDARSDLYSLGATLYFLLSGTPPFQATDRQLISLAHLLEPPEPPSRRRGEPLPATLDALVLRCLMKQPSDRFQSARELLSALDALALGLPWTDADARASWHLTSATVPPDGREVSPVGDKAGQTQGIAEHSSGSRANGTSTDPCCAVPARVEQGSAQSA